MFYIRWKAELTQPLLNSTFYLQVNVGFEVFEIVIRRNDETYLNQNETAQSKATSLKSPGI